MKKLFYNIDCIQGSQKYLRDNSIDLIITDPPYGIRGNLLHKHYNRNEDHVIDGYVEVDQKEYPEFTNKWIQQTERVLRPGGSIYIVSGYTNLRHVLNALASTSLKEINHIIWKYNFGVYTKTKYVSSHYHILYYTKPGGKPTFNSNIRFGPLEKNEEGRVLNYIDREDVWVINREYKPGKKKNKNELPTELLKKMILYSSHPGDLVCDFFLGSFSTAKVAIGLNRKACGFELSKSAFVYQQKNLKKIKPGCLLEGMKLNQSSELENQGKRWTEKEKAKLKKRYSQLYSRTKNKADSIEKLVSEFQRGRFAIANILKDQNGK